MEQYIKKFDLVAEIKRRKELVSDPILLDNDLMIGEKNAYSNLLSFIDNLEVTEVDSEKETIYTFKKGDKVIIHCNTKRHDKIMFEIYNGKVGTIQYIGELKTNPWGNIGVIIDGGYNNAFFVEELELVPKEKEVQKGE